MSTMDGPVPLTVEAIVLQPTASQDDPLGQRGHVGLKLSGGLHLMVGDAIGKDEAQTALDIMLEEIGRRCAQAINEALAKKPDA